MLILSQGRIPCLEGACIGSPLYKEAIADFELPEGFNITIDP